MLDFRGLNDHLLGRADEFVQEHIPGGKKRGREYVAGNIHGGEGESFSVNLETGKWADFAFQQEHSGGDLISLYATKYNVSNGDAARDLAQRYGFRLSLHAADPTARERGATRPELVPPPESAPVPDLENGLPLEGSWLYTTASGHPWFYVARYRDEERGKTYRPWSWSREISAWVNRSVASPRPLYRLHEITTQTKAPVMLVEGEKCADAAQKIVGGHYVVTTWPNGAQAWKNVDWSPLEGRDVLVWPDAGEAGIACGKSIQEHLATSVGAKSVKILDVADQPDGWDVADFDGDFQAMLVWARPRASAYEMPPDPDPEPEPLPIVVPDVSPQVIDSPVPIPDVMLPWAEEDAYADNDARALAVALGLAVTERGAPILSEANLVKALSQMHDVENLVWYDEFYQAFFTNKNTQGGSPRQWTDDDDLELAIMFQVTLGMPRVSEDVARRVIRAYCRRNKRHSPKDWITALKWDGTERLEYFFEAYMGTGASDYSRAASKMFWVSMMARVFEPGCKVDTMVILYGAQGARKSSAMELIGGPWYLDCNVRMSEGKDFYLVLRGRLLVELSELDSFRGAEMTRIKQTLSCRNDVYRAPYGYRTNEHPRQCVFVGTTNNPKPGKDVTGARRFMYLNTRSIDIEAIKRDREQLFAEAYVRYKKKERWWDLIDDETANEVAEFYREEDSWEEAILEYVDGETDLSPRINEVTTREIAIKVLNRNDATDLSLPDLGRLRRSMMAIGWTQQKGRGRRRMYYRPPTPPAPAED